MLDVLFNEDAEPVTEKPVYQGISQAKDYFKDSMSYYIQDIAQDDISTSLLDCHYLGYSFIFSQKHIQLFGPIFYDIFTKWGFERPQKRLV